MASKEIKEWLLKEISKQNALGKNALLYKIGFADRDKTSQDISDAAKALLDEGLIERVGNHGAVKLTNNP